jgi:HK97 family phage major capsid protein
MADTAQSIEKTDQMKALDKYIEEKMDAYLASKANDPEVQKKAALQTKYAEAMADAQLGASAKGQTAESGLDQFGKFAMGILKSNNNPEQALAWAEKTYPENKFLHGCFKALTTGTPSEGGFAVPEVLSSDVIKFLYPKLAYSKLGARRIDMPNGNLTLPRFDAKSTCSYIGETGAAGDTKPTIGSVRGSAKKLAALIPVSNDLIRNANPSFDSFVRDDLINSMQLFRDYTAFYGAGTANAPAGIKTQLTSAEKIGSSSTVFTADTPANMKGLLMAKNVPMIAPGWVFNGYHWSWLYSLKTSTGAYIFRDEMNQGKLLGDPFVVSNQIYSDNLAGGTAPTSSNYGEMFYGDWSEFIEFVQLDMELMASKEASYVNSSGSTVSAMQNDMTVLRALSLHDFGLRHKESFVMSTNKYSLT